MTPFNMMIMIEIENEFGRFYLLVKTNVNYVKKHNHCSGKQIRR